MNNKEIKKRTVFLQKYTDFDNWLFKLGFNRDKSYKSTPLDFHYSWYNEKIDSMYSVEHYINKRLNMSIRFLRDKNKHLFMVVGELGCYSELLNINEFKELIRQEVIKLRNERLEELQFFDWL